MGSNDLSYNLELLLNRLRKNAPLAVLDAAQHIGDEALPRTPQDTGALRESFYIAPTAQGAEVGYTMDYAPQVHELMVSHKIGSAKFLDLALVSAREDFMHSFQSNIESVLKGNQLSPAKAYPSKPKNVRYGRDYTSGKNS